MPKLNARFAILTNICMLEIEKAKKYGFLPDYMQNNYQNNITRAEAAAIINVFHKIWDNNKIFV